MMNPTGWLRRMATGLDARATGIGGARRRGQGRRLLRPTPLRLEDRCLLSTLIVNQTGDDGSTGTLRWAIGQADKATTDTTIDIALPGTGGTAKITLNPSNGPLVVDNTTASITIDSQGTSGGVTVDGNGASSVFQVQKGTTASISGLTIEGASSQGGIYSLGTLTLQDCTISGNTSTTAGGGIVSGLGDLSMNHCTVSDNYAGLFGGGIGVQSPYTSNTVALTDCTIANNTAWLAGGGIFIKEYTAHFKLNDCTISGNTAGYHHGEFITPGSAYYGGGIATNSTSSSLYNCTISGNSSSGESGGIALAGQGFQFSTLEDCTITGNSASITDGGIGFGSSQHFTSVNLSNTILSGNDAPSYSDTSAQLGFGGNSYLFGVGVPLLGKLGNYGGPTETIPLLPGSPAIGAGVAVAGLTTDQRGVARPPSRVDIGAFQDQGFDIALVSGTGGQSAGIGTAFGNALTVKVTSPAGDPVQGGIVDFSAPSAGASAVLSAQTATIGPDGTATVQAVANGIPGTYSVTVEIPSGVSGSPVASITIPLTNTEPTTTTVAASASSTAYGQDETLTATVAGPTGDPTPSGGTVTFYDGNTALGTAALSDGTATLVTSSLAVGSHQITASYGGTAEFDPSVSVDQNAFRPFLSPVNGVSQISSIAADASGNLFLADLNGGQVVKLTPGGSQSVLVSGLKTPTGVAVANQGNVYVAEASSNQVLKVTPNGTESTVGTNLSDPFNVAVDGQGDVFITEPKSGDLVKVTPSGVQSTVASGISFGGTGNDIAADPQGDVFITEAGGTVVKISPSGVQTTIASGFKFGYVGIVADAAGDVFFTGAVPSEQQFVEVTATGDQIVLMNSPPPDTTALAVDGRGNLAFASQVFNSAAPGVYRALAGVPVDVTRATPTIDWPAPAAITYGTTLSPTQLDATAVATVGDTTVSIPGTFTYSQPVGTLLRAGQGQALQVSFTPDDSADYTTASGFTTIDVAPATLTITADPASKVYGSAIALGSDAFTVTGLVAGDSVASVAEASAGAPATAAAGQYPIVPSGAVGTGLSNYDISYTDGTLTVMKATPTITWAAPAAIVYGTALSGSQLDAKAAWTVGGSPVAVAGTFTYTPAAGTVLGAGTQTLSEHFVPADTTDYNIPADQTVLLVVNRALTTTTVSAPATAILGEPLTITATVTTTAAGAGTPAGTVSFLDATTGQVLGSSPVGADGTAVLTTSNLAIGDHTIAASYDGNSNFLPSESAGGAAVDVVGGIMVLDPSGAGALDVTGGASVSTTGAIVVDSSSSSAITATGSGKVTAGLGIQVAGGVKVTGGASLSPQPVTGAPTVADPLAGLPVPPAGASMGAVDLGGSSSLTIAPGVYSAIQVSGGASLTLEPGVYVIAGGGLKVGGSGRVIGTGVVIDNAGGAYPAPGGTSGPIAVDGAAAVELTAPTSGPYAGIALFETGDAAGAISVTGSGALDLTGALSAPSARLSVSGSAALTETALVVNDLRVTGSGSVGTPPGPAGRFRSGAVVSSPAPVGSQALDLTAPAGGRYGISPAVPVNDGGTPELLGVLDPQVLGDLAASHLLDGSRPGRNLASPAGRAS